MSKKRIILLTTFAALLTAAPVQAAPDDKPWQAADTASGTSCIVRGSVEEGYDTDLDCSWHRIIQRDENGVIVGFRYQDKGMLQEGQTAPETAVRLSVTQTIAGLPCSGTETVTPSGNYSSNLTCPG